MSSPPPSDPSLSPATAPPSDQQTLGEGGTALALNLAVLVLLLSFVVVAGKMHKLVTLAAGWQANELLAVLGLDLALLLFLSGACAFVLASARRVWRYAMGSALYIFLLLLLLAGLVEHAFFAIQHEFLPGEMLVYGVRELRMILAVVVSKVGAEVWLTLGGVGLALVLTAVFSLTRPALRRMARLAESVRRRSVGPRRFTAAWGAALVACVALSRLEVRADLRHLKGNAILTLAREALRSDPEESGARGDSRRGLRLTLVPTAATRLHNVVFIVLESTRARSVTAYTPALDTTPFLGRLAEQGVRVEHAYAVVPHTSKALVPIECGVHPKITTAIQEANPGGMPSTCLAEALTAQGYATAFIQPAQEEFEGRRGLVANFGFRAFIGKESLPSAAFEESSYFGYEDESMLLPALQWVDRQTGPFFLTLLTLTAHHDYRLPTRLPKRNYAPTEPLNRYLNALAYTDRFLERLFRGLEERSLMANTLFVIVGDHGEAFGEHGRFEHDNVLYQEGIGVPLLLVGAGLEEMRGRVVHGLRETSDIVPTVLEILGFRIFGGDLQGRSLLSTPGHDRLFFSCWYTRQCLALREGSTKTIYHYERLPPEVFDLAADPLERRSLAADSAHREALGRDIERLKAWKRQNNARYRPHAGDSSSGPAGER